MIKKAIAIAALATTLILSQACKKEINFEVEERICSQQGSINLKHKEFQDLLDHYALSGIPGLSVVITQSGEEDWVGSAGFASMEDNRKMTPCHLHHTASLAKSFIAVLTLQLIEEGSLSLESKVSDFLSNEVKSYTPNIDELTIEHLLQQTSGIPDVFGIDFLSELMNDPSVVYTREDLLSFNQGSKPLDQAGNQHFYSDHNFILLSLIIDQIEGSHIDALRKRIFEPLALEDIHYHDDKYPFLQGLSATYWDQYNDGKWENISDLQNLLTSYIQGSDGIISSPISMTKFYERLFDGELLNSSTLEMIQSKWVTETDENRMNTSYSHGFMVIEAEDGDWMGHAGLQIGASSYVFHNLDSRLTIGVFTNAGTFTSQEKKALIYGDLWTDLRALFE